MFDGEGLPPAAPTDVMPSDVAAMVDTPVDPGAPRIAEPTPPVPPTPPARRGGAKVDTHDTPVWWLVALGVVVIGAGLVLAMELADRFGKKD